MFDFADAASQIRNEVRELNGLVPIMMLFLQPPNDMCKIQALKAITNLSINGTSKNRRKKTRKKVYIISAL